MSAGYHVLHFDGKVNGYDRNSETWQRQVFYVPKIEEGEDLSSPPVDGTQYLKRVVAERRRCDAVVTKKIKITPKGSSGNQMFQFSEVQRNCGSKFYMDKETQMRNVSDFDKLRRRYEACREKITEEKLQQLSKALPRPTNEAGWLKVFSSSPNLGGTFVLPYSSVELCLAIPQHKICQVMEYVVEWITEGELNVPKICQWVHMLLACVDLPLKQDLCATMRAMVRALIVRRSQLESPVSEELPHINLIICIVGRYFEQFDLADPIE